MKVFGIILVSALLLYGNTLDNQFLSDDLAEIVNNPQIGQFSNVINHFYGFIRPLINFLLVNIFGVNPFAFHLVNVLFHAGSAFLAFKIVKKLTEREDLATLTTAFFLVHPLLSEAVSWVSGGIYVQYSFFFLASFYSYIQKRYLHSTVLAGAAIMSHQIMALTLILTLVLYELAFGQLKKNWVRLLPTAGIFLLLMIFTMFTISERVTTLQTIHYQDSGVDNIFLLIPAAISSYMHLLVWPDRLTIYQSELGFSTGEYLIRVILTLAYFGGVIYLFTKNRLLAFFAVWPLIIISPTLNPFRMNWIVAERYFYLAGFGVFTALAIALSKPLSSIKLRTHLTVFLVILLLAFSIRTFIRNNDWQDADSLWLAAERTSPSSPNNHNNLGDLYGRRGDYQRAIQEFQTAIALKSNYADAYHNMGNTYAQIGETEKAYESYQNALKFNPNLWQSYQNIAALHFNQGDFKQAAEYMLKVTEINPYNPAIYYNLGVIYLKGEEREKASQAFTKALELDPNYELAKQGLSEANK